MTRNPFASSDPYDLEAVAARRAAVAPRNKKKGAGRELLGLALDHLPAGDLLMGTPEERQAALKRLPVDVLKSILMGGA